MLERFRAQGIQQKILNEADDILNSKDGPQKAVHLLTEAILQNPTDQKLYKKLGEVSLMNGAKDNNEDQEFEELSNHKKSLAGFEAFITALEQQYMPKLPSADETKNSTTLTRLN